MTPLFPTRQTSPLCALCTRRAICARVSACLDAAEREAMGAPQVQRPEETSKRRKAGNGGKRHEP